MAKDKSEKKDKKRKEAPDVEQTADAEMVDASGPKVNWFTVSFFSLFITSWIVVTQEGEKRERGVDHSCRGPVTSCPSPCTKEACEEVA